MVPSAIHLNSLLTAALEGQDFHTTVYKRGKRRHSEHGGLASAPQPPTAEKEVQPDVVRLQSLGSEPQTKAKVSQPILIFLGEVRLTYLFFWTLI